MSDIHIKLYALSTCSHCKATKKLLLDNGFEYDHTDVDLLMGDERKAMIDEVKEHNPRCSFPTLLIGDSVIVGLPSSSPPPTAVGSPPQRLSAQSELRQGATPRATGALRLDFHEIGAGWHPKPVVGLCIPGQRVRPRSAGLHSTERANGTAGDVQDSGGDVGLPSQSE